MNLLGVFQPLRFEMMSYLEVAIYQFSGICNSIFHMYSEASNGRIGILYKWKTYFSSKLFYALQISAIFPVSCGESVVILKILSDNMGFHVPMAQNRYYKLRGFSKGKSDHEMKIIVCSFLSIWLDFFLFFKI